MLIPLLGYFVKQVFLMRIPYNTVLVSDMLQVITIVYHILSDCIMVSSTKP